MSRRSLRQRGCLPEFNIQLGRREAAETTLQRALSAHADSARVWKRAAELAFSSGDSTKATEYLGHAAAVEPQSVEYRAELAAQLARLGETGAALQEAFECVRGGRSDCEELYYLGLSLYLGGARRLADAAWRKARADGRVAQWPAYEEMAPSRG